MTKRAKLGTRRTLFRFLCRADGKGRARAQMGPRRAAHLLAGVVSMLVLALALALPGCGSSPKGDAPQGEEAASASVREDGEYTSKDDVALYLHTYGHLPNNYVTKEDAEDAGWKTEGLSLWEACPGKSIGGSHFGNYEGSLPSAPGRTWQECDIDYQGGSRNAKRLVYSNDGLIYYTEDHYQSFEQLY